MIPHVMVSDQRFDKTIIICNLYFIVILYQLTIKSRLLLIAILMTLSYIYPDESEQLVKLQASWMTSNFLPKKQGHCVWSETSQG